jgi:hypothetical protein
LARSRAAVRALSVAATEVGCSVKARRKVVAEKGRLGTRGMPGPILDPNSRAPPVPLVTVVGDSPRGPLKQRGNPHLKPATKPKRNLLNHAGNGPRRRDPDGPSKQPS